MKISANKIRQLRSRKGWPQEQLAKASGLSVRTIQRVESEGVASMNTAVSLAATLDVTLDDLQSYSQDQLQDQMRNGRQIDVEQSLKEESKKSNQLKFLLNNGLLLIGLIFLTIAAINHSMVMPREIEDLSQSLSMLLLSIGFIATLPAIVDAFKHHLYVETSVIALSIPLITLLVAGVIFWFINGKPPSALLILLGCGGIALFSMAIKSLNAKLMAS